MHHYREPLKIASHVGWVKPRQRRTQQNHIVRRVSLRSTHPTFGLLEVPYSLLIVALVTIAGCAGSSTKEGYEQMLQS